jgi:Mce-associated membrane protein
VEDQQPDSGDLTTDAAATPESLTPRARHRMPRGKERRALAPEAPAPEAAPAEAPEPEASTQADEVVATEEQSTTAEETTPPVQEPETKPRRRWNLLRRKKAEEPAAEAQDEAQPDESQADEAPTTDDTATAVPATDAEAPVNETEGEATESEPEAAEEAPAPVFVPHQPAGRRLKIVAAAAAVLFVAGVAFVAAMAQPVIANRAMVRTKLDIARTAQSAITTLWSYTPDNMDSLGDRSARYLTGDFASQYRKFIDSIVATNKQAQVTNTTDVLGTAVESVSGPEATALVYTNSVATSPVSKNIPSLRYLSYRLEMKHERSDWRITKMTTITTLDLTPQL